MIPKLIIVKGSGFVKKQQIIKVLPLTNSNKNDNNNDNNNDNDNVSGSPK